MQGPGGAEEDPSGAFRHGGWIVPYSDEDMGRMITAIFEAADAFLIGRTTYELFQPYWSQVTDPENAVATALNGLPKYVATHRPGSLAWKNTHALKGDLVEAVRELKKRPGRELQVHGSHGLIQSLLATGLVDQFNIFTFPVLVGGGKRLFGTAGFASSLRLLSSEVTSRGAIFGRYEPSGNLDLHKTFKVVEGKETVA
jgi:dihydrofolate reductase